jgi:hypothetical protein
MKSTNVCASPQKMALTPRWLTLKIATGYANLSRSSLYCLIDRGDIKAAWVSVHGTGARGKRLVDRESLDQYLATSAEASK